jgi:hypothetical protein
MINKKQMNLPGILASKKAGESLSVKEQKELVKFVLETVEQAALRRKRVLLSHNNLKDSIGIYFQAMGVQVNYEVAFIAEGSSEKVSFDIIAEKGKQMYAFELQDQLTSEGLQQIYGHIHTLQLTKTKAKVILGTDILIYPDFWKDMTGETIKDLMVKDDLGVMLVDNNGFAIICLTYPQLNLTEMPELWFL